MAEHRSRNWALGLVLAAVTVEIVYLAAANYLLNSDFLRSKLNRDPDRLSVQWSGARTVVPGTLRVKDLQIRSRKPKREWDVTAGDARARLALMPLFSRTVRIEHLEGDAVAFSLRKGEAETADQPKQVPESTGRRPGWNIAIVSADITGIRSLELYENSFVGKGRLRSDDILLQPGLPVSVGRARLQLASAGLSIRSEPYLKNLRIDTDLELDPFSFPEYQGVPVKRFLSGSVDITGDMTAIYNFVETDWLNISGTGTLKASLHIKHGTLSKGTELSVDSPDLTALMGAEQTAELGGRYRVRGAGILKGDVLARDDESQTGLQLVLHDAVMDRQHREHILLRTEKFELAATTGLIDLAGGKKAEPIVTMAWKDATISDVAVLNDYLPASLPFSPVSGSTVMNGHLQHAGGIVSGALNLAGEAITSQMFGEEVIGGLGLDLNLVAYDTEKRRLDFSGSSVRMHMTAPATGGPIEKGPLVSELNVLEGRLEYAAPGETPPPGDGPPPVSGTLKFEGTTVNIGFLKDFLPEDKALDLDGDGRIAADLRISEGRLAPGSRLEASSNNLVSRFLDFEATGRGTVGADVRSTAGGEETRLQVDLGDVRIRSRKRGSALLHGKNFQLTATIPGVDLEAGVEPKVVVEWADAVMPDVAVLNDYLPASLPFSPVSGSTVMNGRLEYAGGIVSGSCSLAGEGITSQMFGEEMIGGLGLDLKLVVYDTEKRRLDFSGSSVRMQMTAPATDGTTGKAQLVSELNVLEGRLEYAAPGETPPPGDGPPPVSGTLKFEGTTVNIGFLKDFLPEDKALDLDGDGRIAADLRISEGRLAPGSRLEASSNNLVSRFLDFEVTGRGTVDAVVGSTAEGEETRLQVGLGDVRMRSRKGGPALLHGKSFRLTATRPGVDLEADVEPKVVVEWTDAFMPDVAVLNDYLPASLPFSPVSGSTVMNGHLKYADEAMSGVFSLAGEGITGIIMEETVTGRLDVDLVIKELNRGTRKLDLAGTRISMQASALDSAEAGQEPLKTEINILEAWLEPVRLRGEPEGQPFDGALKLEGSIAHIGFFNMFVPDEHDLRFAGNGAFAADLQVEQGRVAPGSVIEITSESLTSRFLDFEARGSGTLNAGIGGTAQAPTGKVGLLLSDLSLRRLDEPTPYIQGNSLELVTVGKHFDTQEGLKDLDTTIKLSAAEIPDISIYNTYLPPDAGLDITSGTGRLQVDLRLKGASASGMMELQADGVAIRLRDQTLKGKLRITTRLREGNLDDMTFDVSGTQLRIEDARLEREGESGVQEQWWGQIDLEKARMTWKRPLALEAEVAIKLRDSGLLVQLFVKNVRQHPWLGEMLTITDVAGRSMVKIDDTTVMLKNTDVAGDGVLVLVDLHMREKNTHGALYARSGLLGLGVHLRDDVRKWKIWWPRRWYDRILRESAVQPP